MKNYWEDMWESYENFIEGQARNKFENAENLVLDDEELEKFRRWAIEHPDMMSQIDAKAEKYEKLATQLRDSQAPEYLQGIETYQKIINQIKETFEPAQTPDMSNSLTYYITPEQEEILRSLIYLGVPARNSDISKDVGVPFQRIVPTSIDSEKRHTTR